MWFSSKKCKQSIVRIAFLSPLMDLQAKYIEYTSKRAFSSKSQAYEFTLRNWKSSWVVSILNITTRNKGFTSQI